MEAKVEKKERSFNISAPVTGYARTMRFNRFCFEQAETYILGHCGYVSDQGTLLDIYTFAVSKEDLETNRESMLKYLDRIGGPSKEKAEQWSPPSDRRPIDAVRMIATSHRGNSAELALGTFSQSALSGKMKSTDLVSQPVALLTCTSEIQKQIITQLYLAKWAQS